MKQPKKLYSEDGYKIELQKDGSYSDGDIEYANLEDALATGFFQKPSYNPKRTFRLTVKQQKNVARIIGNRLGRFIELPKDPSKKVRVLDQLFSKCGEITTAEAYQI